MINTEKPANQFKIEWIPGGFLLKLSDPDPAHPDGVTMNLAGDKSPQCECLLPYPARGPGMFRVSCRFCALAVVVGTIGRSDDPVKVIMPCKSRVDKDLFHMEQ